MLIIINQSIKVTVIASENVFQGPQPHRAPIFLVEVFRPPFSLPPVHLVASFSLSAHFHAFLEAVSRGSRAIAIAIAVSCYRQDILLETRSPYELSFG